MKNNPWVVWEWFPSIRLWWAQVTVTPEERRIAVFKRGIWNGLKTSILRGGHIFPNSIVGESLLWKKAQKKLIKKNTSEIINKIIPHRNPKVTGKVCNPWKVPSREISRHHWNIVNNVIKFPKINKSMEYWWNHLVNPAVNVNAPIALVKGQGL